jgi:basic membrane lipoprotein Med (substrate-binding protein (PBP1-ABC) superfamily)
VSIKLKISKKTILRLAIFVALIGVATLFDIYIKEGKVKIAGIEAGSSDDSKNQNTIHLISQSFELGVKTYVQKSYVRKVQLKQHDKYIRNYYQLRNNQVLKAEVQTQTEPIINTYHYLAYKHFIFLIPDDEDPLIS